MHRSKFIVFNITTLAVILLTAISGCTKTEETSEVPSIYTKRVVVEEFSGEWCSSCVTGAKKFMEILDNNPEKTIGVSIHSDDPLELEFPAIAPFLISEFNVEYFPDALIDRLRNETIDWDIAVNQRLEIKPGAGIKLETKLIENQLIIEVKFVANSDFENVLLSVYLVEDNVPESSPGAQAAGGGNYIHQRVLRKVLTSKIGQPVELNKGKIYSRIFSSNISKYKEKDLSVVAFLHFGSDRSYEIINGNQAKAGQNAGW